MKRRMDEKYLDKAYCDKKAGQIIWKKKWNNVSHKQLAKEIYGHAFVFYRLQFLSKCPCFDKMIYRHTTDGIDLENKVDRYQVIWEILWKIDDFGVFSFLFLHFIV